MLLSFLLQNLAVFSLFRIDANLHRNFGRRVFNIVGCHWTVFLFATAGVGFSLWFAGFWFVFDLHVVLGLYDESIFLGISLAFFFAACCQLMVGISMLEMNRRAKVHFGTRNSAASDGRSGVVGNGIIGARVVYVENLPIRDTGLVHDSSLDGVEQGRNHHEDAVRQVGPGSSYVPPPRN